MKLICGPKSFAFETDPTATQVVLYSRNDRDDPERATVGAMAKWRFAREKLSVNQRAWDFLSFALSVITADFAEPRERSPDGWTRTFDMTVAVAEPDFWNSQATSLQAALAFLTTDRWRVQFVPGGDIYDAPNEPAVREEDCVLLLSGGLDSLIGGIDLVRAGKKPIAVSQLVRGDAEKQLLFANKLGPLKHLSLNHNATAPEAQASLTQRSRSLIFLAFGIAAATSLQRYHQDEPVILYICENGFIALNPPLTDARIGSLSTRTAHPYFLNSIQSILDASGLRVTLTNPYAAKTKGEMLKCCADQAILQELAFTSTSCARFLRFGYRHCGRCVPCQIRRAAFLAWGVPDSTVYTFNDLGKDNAEHAGFDDVRSAAMAIAQVKAEGLDGWVRRTLSRMLLGDTTALKDVVRRGLGELETLHRAYKIK